MVAWLHVKRISQLNWWRMNWKVQTSGKRVERISQHENLMPFKCVLNCVHRLPHASSGKKKKQIHSALNDKQKFISSENHLTNFEYFRWKACMSHQIHRCIKCHTGINNIIHVRYVQFAISWRRFSTGASKCALCQPSILILHIKRRSNYN